MKKYVESDQEVFILMNGTHLMDLNGFMSIVETKIPEHADQLVITSAYLKYPYVYPVLTREGFEEGKVGIYGNTETDLISFNVPLTDEDKKYYHARKITQLPDTLSGMVEEMQSITKMFRDDKETELINLNSSTTKYVIKDTDDFLKLAIKQVINAKDINVDAYKDTFQHGHTLSNMKQILTKDSKELSIKYFTQWCMTLGLKCDITLSDNGKDEFKPLKDPVRTTFNA